MSSATFIRAIAISIALLGFITSQPTLAAGANSPSAFSDPVHQRQHDLETRLQKFVRASSRSKSRAAGFLTPILKVAHPQGTFARADLEKVLVCTTSAFHFDLSTAQLSVRKQKSILEAVQSITGARSPHPKNNPQLIVLSMRALRSYTDSSRFHMAIALSLRTENASTLRSMERERLDAGRRVFQILASEFPAPHLTPDEFAAAFDWADMTKIRFRLNHATPGVEDYLRETAAALTGAQPRLTASNKIDLPRAKVWALAQNFDRDLVASSMINVMYAPDVQEDAPGLFQDLKTSLAACLSTEGDAVIVDGPRFTESVDRALNEALADEPGRLNVARTGLRGGPRPFSEGADPILSDEELQSRGLRQFGRALVDISTIVGSRASAMARNEFDLGPVLDFALGDAAPDDLTLNMKLPPNLILLSVLEQTTLMTVDLANAAQELGQAKAALERQKERRQAFDAFVSSSQSASKSMSKWSEAVNKRSDKTRAWTEKAQSHARTTQNVERKLGQVRRAYHEFISTHDTDGSANEFLGIPERRNSNWHGDRGGHGDPARDFDEGSNETVPESEHDSDSDRPFLDRFLRDPNLQFREPMNEREFEFREPFDNDHDFA